MRIQNCLAIVAAGAIPAGCVSLPRRDEEDPRWADGGLTILSYDDLTNDPQKDSAAILIQQPSDYATVVKSCALLNESPLNPDEVNFEHGLNNSLSYQVYLKNFKKSQLFLVAKEDEDGDVCRAIDYKGEVSEVDCEAELPGLCSQSAPVSTQETNDDPTNFRVDHKVGTQVYTGFRDFFVWKFRGIRYAAQPKRFEHSTVYRSEEKEPVPALKAGADCLQPIGEVREGMSEDCTFLNVWTPSLPPAGGVTEDKLKPVMFYIYGGGFTSGSGKNPNTDGTHMAARGDVVAVSVNYRVSNLGHLNFNDGKHNGNYGLGDIVTALEWVKENIADFGGDASRVTIYGESAGAVAVRALLASPKAKGLFSNAISQSGPAGLTRNEASFIAYYDSLGWDYLATTTKVLYETGCDVAEDAIECLREYNATELVNLENIARGIVQDGEYIDVASLPLDGSGLTEDVAFMTGTNRDELGVDFDMPEEGASIFDALDIFGERWGIDLSPLLLSGGDLFPIPNNPTPADVLDYIIRLGTDGVYTCMEEATNYAAARSNTFQSLYSFMFNRTYNPAGYTKPHCGPPATEERPNGDPDLEYYKCHAGEQMIVFGTIRRDSLPDRDGLDVPFSQLVMDYWTSFARSRDPNPPEDYLLARGYHNTLEQIKAVGQWEPATAEEPNLRMLQWNGGHVPLPETDQCDTLGIDKAFWEWNEGGRK